MKDSISIIVIFVTLIISSYIVLIYANDHNKNALNLVTDDRNSLWGNIGSALGGAITGGFISSYLQSKFSRKDFSEKQHLVDLKEQVVNPLIAKITIYNFNFSTIVNYFEKECTIQLKSDNLLFIDLVESHIPGLDVILKNLLTFRLNREKIRISIEQVVRQFFIEKFESISSENEEYFNKCWISNKDNSQLIENFSPTSCWIDTLIQYILQKEYEDTFLRITTYYRNRYLYLSNIEDDLLPFGDNREKHLIYSVAKLDEKINEVKVNKLRNELIELIHKIIDNIQSTIEQYIELDRHFNDTRQNILNLLLEYNYSYKFVLVKNQQHIKRKCGLIS